jgi:hypothetical protein
MRADFVDKFTIPEPTKIDMESILESLATEQKTISEYEQHPWVRDIGLRVKWMGALATSALTYLYKSRVMLKDLPANHRRNKFVHRNTDD